MLRGRKGDDFESVCRRLTDTAPPAVSRGVSTYVDQWKAAGRLEK